MTAPELTFIAVCYNHSRFVLETLNSIAIQSGWPFELIITDDASTDHSAAIIEKWIEENKSRLEVKFIRNHKNQGLCKTLNQAIAASNGKWLKPISADDILDPDYLSEFSQVLTSETPQKLWCCDMSHISEAGDFIRSSNWDYNQNPISDDFINNKEILLDGPRLNTPTLIFKKSLWEEIGGYDEALSFEDWDFLLRARRVTRFGFIKKSLVAYRLHDSNMHKRIGREIKFSQDIIRLLGKNHDLFPDIVSNKLRQHISGLLVLDLSKGIEEWQLNKDKLKHIIPRPKAAIMLFDGKLADSTILSISLNGIENMLVIGSDLSSQKGLVFSNNLKDAILSLETLIGLDSDVIIMQSSDTLLPGFAEELNHTECPVLLNIGLVSSHDLQQVKVKHGDLDFVFRPAVSEQAVCVPLNQLKSIIKTQNSISTLSEINWQIFQQFSLSYTHQALIIREVNFEKPASDSNSSNVVILTQIENSEALSSFLKTFNGKEPEKDSATFIRSQTMLEQILKSNSSKKIFDQKELKKYLFDYYWSKNFHFYKDELNLKAFLSLMLSPLNLMSLSQKIKQMIKRVI